MFVFNLNLNELWIENEIWFTFIYLVVRNWIVVGVSPPLLWCPVPWPGWGIVLYGSITTLKRNFKPFERFSQKNHLGMQIFLALHSQHIMLCLISITREIKQQHKIISKNYQKANINFTYFLFQDIMFWVNHITCFSTLEWT